MRKTQVHSVLLVFSFLFLQLNIPIDVLAQKSAVIEWQKNYGGSGNDNSLGICNGINGGYIICGFTGSTNDEITGNHGSADGWVISIDATGKLQWQKCLGGTDADDIQSIIKAGSGYIAAGFTQSTDGDVAHNNGSADGWVVHLSSTGSIIWEKNYGGSNFDLIQCIRPTNDGGYIFCGETGSIDGDLSGIHTAARTVDAWVVKLDASGNIAWQKSLGGSNQDAGSYIQQTSDSGYIMVGSTQSADGDVSGYHDSTDIWVVKLDVHGSMKWQKCLGGNRMEGSFSIRQTSDGGYIVGGTTRSSDGDVTYNHGLEDYWVVKLDADGTLNWQKTYGGSGGEQLFDIIQTYDGGYIMTGLTTSHDGDVTGLHRSSIMYSDEWVVRTDAKGKLLWQKCLGGSSQEAGYEILQVTDSVYVTTGNGCSKDGDMDSCYGPNDYWVVQLKETDTTTGIINVSTSNEIVVYPTITNGVVNVRLPDGMSEVSMKVTDINGKIITTSIGGTGKERTLYIPQGTAAGMLVLQIRTQGSVVVSRKIVYRP
ncbi:MAG: hypothetical protein JSS96_00115 [Bacteroidetes bacterium]|nr:hypothetical protein [Bacteroidota bacterium]